MENLIEEAIEWVGLTKLTKACGLASTNSLRKWAKAGKVPLAGDTDYPGIIERETAGRIRIITREKIWLRQLDDIKPGIVYTLPVALLQRDPQQPREQFDPDGLQALASSLVTDGQESPIKFRLYPLDEETPLMIVHGERRWRASQLAGLATLQGVLDTRQEEDSAERIFRQIADNMGEALTPWDWASTFNQLHDDGYNDQYITDQLLERGIKGFSRPVISNYRRLFNLPDSLQQLVQTGWLTPSHGKYLLQLNHPKTLSEISAKLIERRDKEEESPTIGSLEYLITRTLRDNCHGLTVHGNGTHRAWFDIEQECEGCKKKQKFDGELYCLNAPCWQGKQGRHEEQEDAAREKRDELVEKAIEKTEAGEPTFYIEDPDLQQEVDEEIQWRQKQQERELVHQAKETYLSAVKEALKTADLDVILAIIIADPFLDDMSGPEAEDLGFLYVINRLKADRQAMLLNTATSLLKTSYTINTEDVGRVLGIEPVGITPTADNQQADLLEAAQ